MTKKKEKATPDEGTPKDESELIGTSADLFPDLMEDQSRALVEPNPKTEEPEPKSEPESEPEVEQEIEAKEEPVEPEYFDLDSFKDKKVKVKIDGVEGEATLQDLIKGYQTDRHLTQKGQKIAEERRKLEEFKAEMLKEREKKTESEINDDPYLSKIISMIDKKLDERTTPLLNWQLESQYEKNLRLLDNDMKSQGFNDFMKYWPEIEPEIQTLPPQSQAMVAKSLYFEKKFKEKPESKISPDARPKPKVTPVESSTTPTNISDTSYQEAFNKAKETGDWSEVYKLKGIVL